MLLDMAAKEQKDILVDENSLAQNATIHGLFKQRWREGLFAGEELQGMKLRKQTRERGWPTFSWHAYMFAPWPWHGREPAERELREQIDSWKMHPTAVWRVGLREGYWKPGKCIRRPNHGSGSIDETWKGPQIKIIYRKTISTVENREDKINTRRKI